jgi:transcriptional regulator
LSTKSESQSKAEQLQWRRSKVVEMRAKGMSQIEIARELQISDSSISSDVQYLREQAKGTIKEYATDHLPEQYQVCLVALDEIIKRAFDILENSDENREKLQAMDQGYRSRLTLGSTIITINFVKSGWQTAF